MTVKVIIGANFGDEGKGLMTSYFSNRPGKNIVVCSNGGPQRGHTVVTSNKIRHIFRHFGSGTLQGVDTYFCKEFMVNPVMFNDEYDELFPNKTIHTPQIFMHPDCLYITPFDMIINRIIENNRGDNKHGSCGVGIWETILRCERGYTLNYSDFKYMSECRKKLLKIRDEYLPFRLKEKGIKDIPNNWKDIIYNDGLILNYLIDCELFNNRINITKEDFLRNYDNIIFENGQGLLLDQNIKGYGKNTTPSNTGIINASKIIKKYLPDSDVEICYVTRTYMTRHGAGRFDSECNVNEINSSIEDKTNIPNDYQGIIRYGKIDLNNLCDRCKKDFKLAKNSNFKISLAITHVNETSNKFADNKNTPVTDMWEYFDYIYTSFGETYNDVIKYGV